MRKYLLLFITIAFLGFSTPSLKAQTAPPKLWDKTFGGSSEERLFSLKKTFDGGFIAGGWSGSGISGDKTQSSKGSADYWIVRFDANGTKIWDKAYGGSNSDFLFSLAQTSDGGFILGGTSYSGISGDKSQSLSGVYDYWVVKIDASGNKVWDRTFGGCSECGSHFKCVQQTSDGGYILGGYSGSDIGGDKTENSKGSADYWVIKLDAYGNKIWDKTIGGNNYDEFVALKQTSDGGFVLGGNSVSPISGDKSEVNRGANDYWTVKLDSFGNKIWDKTFGGLDIDYLNTIEQASDGSILLGGYSFSPISGDKSQHHKGGSDYWIIKLDTFGNKIWDKTLGGNNTDNLLDINQTSDGGFILGGESTTGINGDKSEPNLGFIDYWVLKVDANGNKIWDKTLGGGDYDLFWEMDITTDGGFILGGSSQSGIGGDKTQTSRGNLDYWIVRLAAPCTSLSASLEPICTFGNTDLALEVLGIQPGSAGIPSWTLTYTLNGVTQTATGSTSTYNLAQNAAPGSVFTLVSIVSGTCSANLNQTFTVQPIPAGPQVNHGNGCGVSAVVLSATGAPSGGSYIWYEVPSGGTAVYTNASGNFTTPALTASTTYYVAASNNSGCEGPRMPVSATITQVPVDAGTAETVCATAAPLQLTGFSPTGGTWSGPGVSASGVFTPSQSLAGKQTLTYTVTQNGCSFSATKQITIPEAINLGPDQEVCEGEEKILSAANFPGTYLWSNGATSSSISVRQSDNYWVQLTQNGCITSDSIKITFNNCPKPFIPNILTLNSDGKNETFKPKNLPAGPWQLQIYSRWGTLIYEAKDYQNNWPDNKISDAIYYYLLRNPETGQQFKGWIEVTH